MQIKFRLLFLAIFISLISCAPFNPSRYAQSGGFGSARLFWTVDQTRNQISLAVQIQTTGWIGFGIGESTSGSMKGADIFYGHVDTTTNPPTTTIIDSYGLGFFAPTPDACQNWLLVNGDESNGTTTIEVTRALDTGDLQDRPFLPGLLRVIYAYGNTDTFSYHGNNRGTNTVLFYGTAPQVPPLVNANSFVATMGNFTIPTDFTTYACKAIKLPQVNASIVRFEPFINPSSHPFTHHMIVHSCKDTGNDSYVRQYQTAGPCGSPVGNVASGCSSSIFIWAVGTQALQLPEDVGFPMGTYVDYGATDIVIEFHYTNPAGTVGVVDNSGVNISYTTDIRPISAGVLTLGDPFVLLPEIPAGVRNHHVETTCSSNCTTVWSHDINVFADFLHMHSIGERMFSNQFDSNGNLIRTMNRVDFYSYSLEQLTPVNYTLRRGDRINTHCVFDSTSRNSATRFGIASDDEMCMNFLWYYPLLFDNGFPYSYCGYLRQSRQDPNSPTFSVCGTVTFIPNLPNPDVRDPVNRYPPIFGNQTNTGNCLQSTSTTSPSLTTGRSETSNAELLKIGNVFVFVVAFVFFMFF